MPKSYKTVEIEQKCEYGFTETFVSVLLDNWSVVKDYAWIVHDKDKKSDGSLKDAHIHLMIRFNSAVPTTAILSRCDNVSRETIKENQLQKCYKWTSAIAYLTHLNAPGKYQYDESEVHSNYDWQEDAIQAVGVNERIAQIVQGIADETIREFNYTSFITAEEFVNPRIRQAYDDALKWKLDNLNLVKGAHRNMEVMYIEGKSGTGKTLFAKDYCEKKGFSYCVSSSSNDPLQDYKGQDVLILDDFRGKNWSVEDLLKLLDNNTATSVKSRYRNRYMGYCKMIIITSVKLPSEFWTCFDNANNEPIAQLMRRITFLVHYDSDKYKLRVEMNEQGSDYADAVERSDIAYDLVEGCRKDGFTQATYEQQSLFSEKEN